MNNDYLKATLAQLENDLKDLENWSVKNNDKELDGIIILKQDLQILKRLLLKG